MDLLLGGANYSQNQELKFLPSLKHPITEALCRNNFQKCQWIGYWLYIMVQYIDSQPFLWFDGGIHDNWCRCPHCEVDRHIVCRLCRVPGRWPSRTNQPSPSTLTLDPCPLGRSCIYSYDALSPSHLYLQTREYSKLGVLNINHSVHIRLQRAADVGQVSLRF